MQCERLETDMWLKGEDPVRDAVELGWINSVMKGWKIKLDPELVTGA